VTDVSVVILGIPIPSSSPLFLGIVAVHVAAGLVCTVAGIAAMLASKRAGRHPSAGTVYYWGLVVVFASMAALSFLRWPENVHLFVLGIVSFGAGTVGRAAKRGCWRGWLRWHITGMGISYITLLTAFYVDNGPHLPVWRSLPRLAHWLLPSVVGLPLLIWALRRHPLALPGCSRGRPDAKYETVR
jgi:hypothetical protein